MTPDVRRGHKAEASPLPRLEPLLVRHRVVGWPLHTVPRLGVTTADAYA